MTDKKNSTDKFYLGLNGFVWWVGVVENRADPDFLGRCQVRIFGWHDKFPANMPTKSLPWAHPVTPLGQNTPKPPAEGVVVFGFFMDGSQATRPVMLGEIPGIPVSIPDEGQGFRDQFTAEEKASRTNVFPGKTQSSEVAIDASGLKVEIQPPQSNPRTRLNEPTTSRLARPDRIESPETGESLGVRSYSIEGTAIDFQRKNRVKFIKTAKEDNPLPNEDGSASRRQVVWNEPCPSFNAKFPFNNVTETESGHAFEMDDTPNYERVQVSHKTGSTLEFMPSGSIKEKSFNHKYNIVMGDHKEYVNGDKVETVQGGMFLRINGRLVIQADGIDFESSGDVNLKGKNVSITATNDMNLFSYGKMQSYGAAGASARTEGVYATYGGKGAIHGSGGLTTISGTTNPMSDAVRAALEKVLPKATVENLSSRRSTTEAGVKIVGPNFYTSAAIGYYNTALTQFVPLGQPTADPDDGAEASTRVRAPIPKLKPTVSVNSKEKTDGLCAWERSFVYTKDAQDALKVTALTEDKLQQAANTSDIDTLKSYVPADFNPPTEGGS